MKHGAQILKFWQFLGNLRQYIPLLLGLGILATALEGFGLYLLIPFISEFTPSSSIDTSHVELPVVISEFLNGLDNSSRITVLLSIIITSIVLKNIVTYFESISWVYFDAAVNARVQDRMFDRLLFQKKPSSSRNYGETLNAFENQSWRAVDALMATIAAIGDLVALAFFAVLLTLISWKMMLIALCSGAAISCVIYLFSSRIDGLGQELVDSQERMTGRIWDSLLGLKTIRLYGRAEESKSHYNKAVRDVLDAGIRQEFISSAVAPLAEILVLVAIVFLASISVLQDVATFANFIAFVVILRRALPRLQALLDVRTSVLAEFATIRTTMRWLHDLQPKESTGNQLKFNGKIEKLEAKDLSFSYGTTDELILKKTSFTIPIGKIVGLAGRSGAGKSTIVELLCQLEKPNSGSFFLNDQPLSAYSRKDWLRYIAIVTQDIHLFNGTIRENILFGANGDYSLSVEEAARLSDAHEFISEHPQGYDRVLTNNASQLSGGQRQKIALARALIRDPKLLVLDEAMSAIDPMSEATVQNAIAARPDGCTVLVIAHRPSTLRRVDWVVVLDAGAVTQIGTPKDLSREDGLFLELFPNNEYAP